MNEKQWTPGPWTEGIPGNDRIYGPDGMGDHSGPVAEVMHRYTVEERVANRALIAAAPTLFDALERIKAAHEELARAIVSSDPMQIKEANRGVQDALRSVDSALASARAETKP